MVLEDFQERKEAGRLLASWPALFLLGIFIVLIAWGVLKTAMRYRDVGKDIAEIEKKISENEVSRRDFELRISELQTPEGLEKEARARFNLKKLGEEVVVFLDSDTSLTKEGFRANLASAWEKVKDMINRIYGIF